MARLFDFTDGFTSNLAPSDLSAFEMGSVESISAAGEITLLSRALQFIPIQGDAAAVTASTTPFGSSGPSNGTLIILQGRDSTNTVSISHNDAASGCMLMGDVTLTDGDVLVLLYSATSNRYYEITRNF